MIQHNEKCIISVNFSLNLLFLCKKKVPDKEIARQSAAKLRLFHYVARTKCNKGIVQNVQKGIPLRSSSQTPAANNAMVTTGHTLFPQTAVYYEA